MAKKATGTCVVMVSGMTLNGRPLPDLDYQRTEYDDGTVVETGRPAGVPVGATLDAMFAAALRSPATVPQPGSRVAAAVRSRGTRKGGRHAQA